MDKYEIGSIHGRFQPFHKGHAKYLNAALDRCDFLIIGITQFDIQNLKVTPVANHRSQPANNPLTYNQRCEVIQAYLDGKSVPADMYEFTPFPIEEPEKIKDFIPEDAVCFTTLHHQTWNSSKVEKLHQEGFTVEVLMSPDGSTTQGLSASQVRDLIRKNDPDWKELLPLHSAEKLEESGGVASILNTAPK